ncbi:MAG: Radical domain protein [Firmicutes bacterium]|nr:Radical domain protein [Bacillota bacterium]
MSDSNTTLPYLEFHLTDHCNLNCKGCSHFCPIADENNLIIDTFLRDMKRLSELFTTISKIRIMGGEPLLHPLVATFAEETRRFFPHSTICIVTNGILLPSMNCIFYETLQKNNVTLDISVYPIARDKMSSYILSALQYGIPINFTDVFNFRKDLNASGDSDKYSTFKQCGNRFCTFLRDGKVFHCRIPALSSIANKKLGVNIPGDSYIDIHTNVLAADILEFLNRPSSACVYCTKATWFPWEVSKRKEDEWIV